MSNEDSLEERVHLLKTIADVTRLRILGLLAQRPRTGRELAQELSLTAATVSHHMGRLADVGIATVTPEGTARRYALNAALLADLNPPPPRPSPPGGAADPLDDPEHARNVARLFDGSRLKRIPAKRKALVSVIVELLRGFEPGRRYSEPEVNAILREAHEDVALLRRELVDYRYLVRKGGVYWVNEETPERDGNMAQEVPAGEAEWLAALLRSSMPTYS